MSRVYIVDFDFICPLGIGKKSIWKNLTSDFIAADTIQQFDPTGLPMNIGAEVPESFLNEITETSEEYLFAGKLDRKFQLMMSCYGIFEPWLKKYSEAFDSDRKGIILGLGQESHSAENLPKIVSDLPREIFTNLGNLLEYFSTFGERNISIPISFPDMSAMYLAEKLDIEGFQQTITTACASSTQAIGTGYRAIQNGRSDMVIAGGSDSLLNLLSYTAFGKLGVIRPSTQDAKQTCRPFDESRSGTLLGEGAGLLVLASEEGVKKLGVNPLLEISGYGSSLDGYKITAPDPDGVGVEKAMKAALEDSSWDSDTVDYINLHGTGTRANDPIELDAVKRIFGEYSPSLSSTKDRHGHLIAAAGVVEMGILCLCMQENFVPQTVNLETPLRNDLNLIQGRNQNLDLQRCMSNSFAFGGVNASLAISKVIQ